MTEKAPEYDLIHGLPVLGQMTHDIMAEQKNVTVGITGLTASGKTSAVAKQLNYMFDQKGLILSLDGYFKGREFMDTQAALGIIINWDHPEAVDLSLYRQQMLELKSGKSIRKPVYNFETGRSCGYEIIQPHDLTIAEGLYILDDKVRDLVDIGVFIDITEHGQTWRRIPRDIIRTKQKPTDILRYFTETVIPMQEKYVKIQKRNADIVIVNEYNPYNETLDISREIQLKFPTILDPGFLSLDGVERLGLVLQTDTYYNPDRDLSGTGESLRIREEGDSNEPARYMTLTYKGPKIPGSKFRERPKIEFEIDEPTKKAFLSIYKSFKIIKKKRILYQLNGIVFSLDQVIKIENGRKYELGNFIEIRTTGTNTNRPEIDTVMEKLGLEITDGIKESYVEM